ncbi:uncharacterized protein LOC128212355 [Mya arenaria]|uniref:uncharacterized protein LOC128212355 n=1 Tax=Mya arenaria TaxID=6604 RepID=UPI0022E980D0|nr:uncharacterized protein LOC128212355 [Mya arenaria]
MASKRNLYRPAQTQENVGQRKPRKTLAQGRLITSGGQPNGSVPAAGRGPNSVGQKAGGRLPQGTLDTSSSSQTAGNRAQDRNHLSNTSLSSSQLHQSSIIQGRLEESVFSPRRQVPTQSEARTPSRGPDAGILDLTDSEVGDDTSDRASALDIRSHYQRPGEVLCMNAGRGTVDVDSSMVDVRLGLDNSPVKIVCHSPSRINHTRQQQNLIADTQCNIENEDRLPHKRPVIIKERADDHVDPYTAVQSVPMSPPDRRVLHDLHTNVTPLYLSDSGASDLVHPERLEDRLSDHSDNDSLNMKMKDVHVTNHKVKPDGKTKAPSSVKKEKKLESARKKKGRVIPSRYMQVVETKAKASLSARMDKSSNDSTKASKSLDICPPSAKKTVRKVRPLNTAAKRREVNRPCTPENQSMASSTGGKTSTPTMDCSTFTHDMDIDASAIHPEVSLLAGSHQPSTANQGRSRSRLKPDLTDDLLGQSIVSNVSIYQQSTIASKPKQKRDPKQAQRCIDLQHIYSLQWAFLEAKARRTLQEQEKQAMAQIYGVHEEVERLRKDKAEREQYLARIRHTNTSDHMADVQRQCLGPVVNSLGDLQKQYNQLAYALDTTRHQLPLTDVHIPDHREHLEGELECELLESERLLGEISSLTGGDVPDIINMGTALTAMENSTNLMETELKKSQELLSAVETLAVQECSLRAQGIQSLDQS